MVPKGTNTGKYLKDDGTWATAGGVSQATQAALEAETNEDTYAPPDLIKHSPGVAKAYCWVESDEILQSGSYNVSSVTDNGSGDYDAVWNVDFADTNYVVVGRATTDAQMLTFTDTVLQGNMTLIVAFGDQ